VDLNFSATDLSRVPNSRFVGTNAEVWREDDHWMWAARVLERIAIK